MTAPARIVRIVKDRADPGGSLRKAKAIRQYGVKGSPARGEDEPSALRDRIRSYEEQGETVPEPSGRPPLARVTRLLLSLSDY
jgi:hypothetical protein